jgi:enoyl-CoA hydratase/carnithine racemase
MTDALLINEYATQGGGKIIEATLNATKSLNALSAAMIEELSANLPAWETDEKVMAIVLKGAGDRAFCAGGDIRDLYNGMANNDTVFGRNFFNAEYSLDIALHNLKTPLVVWGNGYVMGGGMGLYQAADVRVVTPSSRLAMPEITIGLYPDVGATLFLQHVPNKLGLFLGLTAAMVNGTDSCRLQLADVLLAEDAYDDFIAALQQGQPSADALAFVKAQAQAMQLAEADAPASDINEFWHQLSAAMNEPNLVDIVAAIAKLEGRGKWMDKAIKAMSKGSPTSQHLTYRQQQNSISQWHETFMQEYYLSVNATQKGEFEEGIRALLIDKDGQPAWRYKTLEEVPTEWVDSFYNQQGIALPDYA